MYRNNQEFNAGLQSLLIAHGNRAVNPDYARTAQDVTQYRENAFFGQGRDPVEELDDQERTANIARLYDLARDWTVDSKARERAVGKWGDDFARQWEEMNAADRDTWLSAMVVDAEVGENHPTKYAAYMRRYGLQDFNDQEVAANLRHRVRAADEDQRVFEEAQDLFLMEAGRSLLSGNKVAIDGTDRKSIAARNMAKELESDLQAAREALNLLISPIVRYGAQSDGVKIGTREGWQERLESLSGNPLENARVFFDNMGFVRDAGDPQVRELADLKESNPRAYAILLSFLNAAAGEIQGDNTPFFTRFGRGLEGGFAGAFTAIDRAVNARSVDQREALVWQDVLAAMQSSFSTPEGAGWWRRQADLLGDMASTTAVFLTTRGVGTFASIAGDEYSALKAKGREDSGAILHAMPAAIGEVVAERFAFGKWGQVIGGSRFVRAIPFSGRVAGTVGRGAERLTALEARMAQNLGTRLLYSTAAGGTGEYFEEFLSPAIAYAVDNAITGFGLWGQSEMDFSELKAQWGELLDPDLAVSMYLFAGAMSGAYVPAMHRDAKFLSMNPDYLQAMGVPREKAEGIANIAKFEDRVSATRSALMEHTGDRQTMLAGMTEAMERLNAANPLRPDMSSVQALMDLGKIDAMAQNDDGTWAVTNRDDGSVSVLTESEAAQLVTQQIEMSDAQDIIDAQEAAIVDKAVDALKGDGVIFEKMTTPGETVRTIEALAAKAGLRMEELQDQGVANSAQAVDEEISGNIPLGNVAGIADMLRQREQIERGAGRLAEGQEGVSYAYRTRLRTGETVIRYAEGRMGFQALLEEAIEIKLSDSLASGRPLQWWQDNLRETQRVLVENGLVSDGFVKADGDLSALEVLEGVSYLARGVANYQGYLGRFGQQVADFIKMLAAWVNEAFGLAQLGAAFRVAADKGHINRDFAQSVYDLAGVPAGYWGAVARQSEAETIRAAEVAASASMTTGENNTSQSNENDTSSRRDGIPGQSGFIGREITGNDLPGGSAAQSPGTGAPGAGESARSGGAGEYAAADVVGRTDRPDGYGLREGDPAALGSLRLREYVVSPDVEETARASGFYTGPIVEIDSSREGAERFHRFIEEGKASQVPYGECVYTYDVEEYEQMRLFVLPNGKAGFALKDGDMVSVFSSKQTGVEGKAANAMVALAVQLGATKADCYGTILPDLYARFGFRAVARDRFNPEFAPESMQQPGHMERYYRQFNDGSPDVVYLVYDGNRARVINDYDPGAVSGFHSLPYNDYDACVAIQTAAVEEVQRRKGNISFSIGSGSAQIDWTQFARTRSQAKKDCVRSIRNSVERELRKARDFAALSGQNRKGDFIRISAMARGVINAAMSRLPQGRMVQLNEEFALAQKLARVEAYGTVWDSDKGALFDEAREHEKKLSRQRVKQKNGKFRKKNAPEVKRGMQEWASMKQDDLLVHVLDRVLAEVDGYLRGVYLENIMTMLDRVSPKVDPKTRKQQRGKIGAENVRWLRDTVVPMMAMSPDDVASRSAEVEGSLAGLLAIGERDEKPLNDADLARVAELERELYLLQTFGAIESATIDELDTASNLLADVIKRGRFAWRGQQDQEKQRRDAIGNALLGSLPRKATPRSLTEQASGNETGKAPPLLRFFSSIHSPVQFFKELTEVKGVEGFAQQTLRRVTEVQKNITLRDESQKIRFDAELKRISGAKNMRQLSKWLRNWMKEEDLKIVLERKKIKKESVPWALAVELLRKWDGGAETIHSQEFRSALRNAFDARVAEFKEVPKGEHKSKAALEFEVTIIGDKTEAPPLSRDRALYVLMLLEQDHYKELAELQGWTETNLNRLREFIGEEGLMLKNWLLAEYDAQGDYIAREYEPAYGVPFPKVQNYAPARFHAFDKISEKDAAQILAGTAGALGPRNGWQAVRQEHNRNIDYTAGAMAVYWQQTAMVTNWVESQQLVTDLKSQLRRREVAEKLVANIGGDEFLALKSVVNTIELGGIRNSASLSASDSGINQAMSAKSLGVLSGKVWSWVKQLSAVMNSFYATEEVGLMSYLRGGAKVLAGQAKLSPSEIMKLDSFKTRFQGNEDIVKAMARMKPGEEIRWGDILAQQHMAPMGYLDVLANSLGFAALYDAVYSEGRKAGKSEQQAMIDAEAALEEALTLGAQPTTWLEKSFLQNRLNGAGKVFTMFLSEAINKVGLEVMYVRQAATLYRQGDVKGAARKVVKMVQVHFIASFINQAIGYLIDLIKDDEERDNKDIEDYLLGLLTGPLGGVPILGEGIDAALNQLFKRLGWDIKINSSGAGRALIDVEGGLNGLGWLYDYFTGDKSKKNASMIDAGKKATKTGVAGGVSLSAFSSLLPGSLRATLRSAGLTISVVSNYLGFGVDVLDGLDIQDEQESIKERKAERRREAGQRRNDANGRRGSN